jgi:uncharacterized membrane protein YraQ (UPF0718 family)
MDRMREKGKSFGGFFFMLAGMALYVVVFFLNEELARDALDQAGKLLSSLAPVLVLVFVMLFLANLLIRPVWVRKHIGQYSGLKGWAVALVSGMLSVGPVYAWYALLRDLREKGMRSGLIAVFLYSRAIKLPLLPLMIHYFGLAYTLLLIAYLLLFSLLNGVAMEKLDKR